MGVLDTEIRYKNLLRTVGKRALNALFPNDIELYIVALELTNSRNQTKEYFIFPVNPSSIVEQMPVLTNIKKTASGVSVLNNNTFTPTNISINGNFGRQFKILLGQELIDFSAIKFSTSAGDFANSVKGAVNIKNALFSTSIKTGYGCTKVLESILQKSTQLDEYQASHSLYFYNLAFNHNYLVKVNGDMTYSQNQESNMIWNYSVKLKSIARVEDLPRVNLRSLIAGLSFTQGAQKLLNNHYNNLKKIIL